MKKFLLADGISIEYYLAQGFGEVATSEIISEITQATSKGFGSVRDEEDMRSHIFDAEAIGIIRKGENLMGFATTQNFQELDLCYLHGIAIASTGCGIGGLLLQRMLYESGMTRYAFTTQNPAMYAIAKKVTVGICPNHDGGAPDVETIKIGKTLIAHRNGHFQDTMVIYELYPECLYPKLPVPKDECLWRWWQCMLQIDVEGKTRDGFIFVGTIR